MQAATIRSTFQRLLLLIAVVFSAFAAPVNAQGQSSRLIIGMSDKTLAQNPQLAAANLSQEIGLPIKFIRAMSGASMVVSINHPALTKAQIHAQLLQLPSVKDVSNDALTRVTSVDDPRFDEQWQLHAPDKYRASLDLVETWNITHGSSDIVIAVVDTGIDYNHPDLAGRILPGYDFVSRLSLSVDEGVHVPDELEYLRSHDGDGRDSDASDPGDSVSEDSLAQFNEFDIDCYVSNSSWHGTAMASIIAANPNDGVGIAGIDWHAKILPVRAIGKCGGHRSDMLDAIRWAAGVDDPSLPPNPTPARIINLSLGVDDLCTSADQSAINEAIAAGAIVVAAVGNNGRNTDVEPSSPSHCQNVIGVMAVDKFGFRASYSNFGRDADVAAPGGDLAPSPNKILVATNNSKDLPSAEFGYRSATGTSVAAPHVAGVLALMLSLKPELSNLELEALLLDSTRFYPGQNDKMYDEEFACKRSICGAGILDALSAVRAVDAHTPGVFLDSPSLAAAQSVPVSVGEFTGFGCTVSKKSRDDYMLFLLMFSAALLILRKRIRVTTL